jgi:hypothetical protein
VCGEDGGKPFKHLRAHIPIDAKYCKTGMLADHDSAPCVHVMQPDARLIAAAPELYEALRDLIDSNAPEHVLAAIAAIAKAEGKA